MIEYNQIYNRVLKELVARAPALYGRCLRAPKSKLLQTIATSIGYPEITGKVLFDYVDSCTRESIPGYLLNFKVYWVLMEFQEFPTCDYGHRIEPKLGFRIHVDPKTLEVHSTLARRCNDKYCAQSNPKTRATYISTCQNKYNGAINAFQDPGVKAKRAATCLRNHGVEVPAKSPKILKKMQDTCLKNNGVVNPWQMQKVKDKTKTPEVQAKRLRTLQKTNMEMYGVPWYVMTDEFKQKTKSTGGTSKEEKELVKWLKTITNEEMLVGTYRVITPQQLDVYFPHLKVAIEFNGTYYHSLECGQDNLVYHLEKTKKCEKLGIKLIHVWEDEWIFRNLEIKTFLASVLDGSFKLDTSKDLIEVDRSKINLCWLPEGYELISETEPNVILRDKRSLDKYRVPDCGKLVFKRVYLNQDSQA